MKASASQPKEAPARSRFVGLVATPGGRYQVATIEVEGSGPGAKVVAWQVTEGGKPDTDRNGKTVFGVSLPVALASLNVVVSKFIRTLEVKWPRAS